MRLYSASTHRSNSGASEASSITARNDCNVSQNDLAVLKSKFQFIRDDEADATQGETDWQVRMSARYYRQLFREYALADLSRYKEGKIGLRWRTEPEVVAGKGQFSCGNKRCDERVGLRSYELLFAYVEHGERKRCLVKVRACSSCAEKLFYKKLMEVRGKNERKEQRKRRRMANRSGNDGKHKAKRRRRSASRSDASSSGGSDGEEQVAEEDCAGQGTEGIHELCARINAEQKAGFTSQRDADARDSEQCCDGFDELLP